MGAQTGNWDYVEEVVLLDHTLELIAAFASAFSKGTTNSAEFKTNWINAKSDPPFGILSQ